MRKFILIILIAFAAMVTGFNNSVLAQGGTAKVQVCHIPPDDPTNFHTITISEKALSAHLEHGDAGGPCDSVCSFLCDDGDPCTVDDTGDCESLGCPSVREPTDCNDSLNCTTDSCDSAIGCVNEPIICEAPDLCTISMCAEDTGECVDSPVVCDAGTECNPATGECELVATCPCWTVEELEATDWTYFTGWYSPTGTFRRFDLYKQPPSPALPMALVYDYGDSSAGSCVVWWADGSSDSAGSLPRSTVQACYETLSNIAEIQSVPCINCSW